ncbi:hypothetical protein CW731_14940 [Polaribacter sp. ALD11]|uniref:hypothetical protein n=1 Tax=Polaribacter sp. ALD11 TaxID=2058137 RepID=UPI000C30FBD8|nr:hypothetical protein [Polaribacter sp. ALD11]AUC86498.1 hypothetical protein CW731_14940 [Polaribacter sp. ALD11]
MNATKLILSVILLITASFSYAQDQEKDSVVSKENYYNKRAKEDAKFEQEFNSKSKSQDKKFWKEQKEYEKELKKRDEVAHKAYMKGKRDAYAEHNKECNNLCSHGYYYHDHVSYYYHGNYSSKRNSNRSSTRAKVVVRTPSIRLGLF